MKTSRTLYGGSRWDMRRIIIYFRGVFGEPVTESRSRFVEIVEHDNAGVEVMRTYEAGYSDPLDRPSILD